MPTLVNYRGDDEFHPGVLFTRILWIWVACSQLVPMWMCTAHLASGLGSVPHLSLEEMSWSRTRNRPLKFFLRNAF
ncbi:hypothetical protein SLA2020_284960 [Shorea laevis]